MPEIERFPELLEFDYKGFPVRIQNDNTPRSPMRFCVQYAGSGKYFETFEEMAAYVKKRFKVVVTVEGCNV